MELAPFVSLRAPEVVLTLASTELPKVLSRLGRHIGEELKLNPSEWFTYAMSVLISRDADEKVVRL